MKTKTINYFGIKFIFLVYFLSGNLFTFAQVGINTKSPDAMLDIVDTEGGILIPRVNLSLLTEIPVRAELVYNTVGNVLYDPGFHYWNGSQWKKLLDDVPVLSLTGDELHISGGNAVILPPVDEPVGTTHIVFLEYNWQSRYNEGYKPFSYFVDRGILHLQGVINGSGANSPIFYTLPEEYRPSRSMLFLVYTTFEPQWVLIQNDGTIRIQGAAPYPNFVALDGIYFKIE